MAVKCVLQRFQKVCIITAVDISLSLQGIVLPSSSLLSSSLPVKYRCAKLNRNVLIPGELQYDRCIDCAVA